MHSMSSPLHCRARPSIEIGAVGSQEKCEQLSTQLPHQQRRYAGQSMVCRGFRVECRTTLWLRYAECYCQIPGRSEVALGREQGFVMNRSGRSQMSAIGEDHCQQRPKRKKWQPRLKTSAYRRGADIQHADSIVQPTSGHGRNQPEPPTPGHLARPGLLDCPS